MIHFVLGGARSGKSRFAEKQALALSKQMNKQAIYIATAVAFDKEMHTRIAKHQNDRTQKGAQTWQLIESPLALTNTIKQCDANNIYLLDCLTLWLNNLLYAEQNMPNVRITNIESQTPTELRLKNEIDELVKSLSELDADIVIVSNEVGMGIVPLGETTRLYVDYCGWLNQAIAGIAQQVTFVTAGLPLTIKSQ